MKPLSFKYKSVDQKNTLDYYTYLKTICNKLDTDLIDYFGFDFFHDGKIEDINIINVFKEVAFKIYSPNLKLFDEDGDFSYVYANFKLHFYNVPWFSSEIHIDRKQDSEITYLYSEINTLKEQIAFCRKDDRRPYKSLLMQTTHGFIGLVFERIWVEPEEPLALELLLRDDRNRELFFDPDIDIEKRFGK